jgi:signal peptidase I
MLWLMKLSRLLRNFALAGLAFFASAVATFAAVERPVSSVSFLDTLSDASKVAARHGDMQVLRVSGRSMLPFFGDGSVVIVKKIEASQLREGMVVVYQNRFGETVAHRVVASIASGLVVQGFNNSAIDSTVVNDANLVGVVYATFHSNGITDAGALASNVAATPVALAAPAK